MHNLIQSYFPFKRNKISHHDFIFAVFQLYSPTTSCYTVFKKILLLLVILDFILVTFLVYLGIKYTNGTTSHIKLYSCLTSHATLFS